MTWDSLPTSLEAEIELHMFVRHVKPQRIRIAGQQAVILKRLADIFSIPVIVTNQARARLFPALGESLQI